MSAYRRLIIQRPNIPFYPLSRESAFCGDHSDLFVGKGNPEQGGKVLSVSANCINIPEFSLSLFLVRVMICVAHRLSSLTLLKSGRGPSLSEVPLRDPGTNNFRHGLWTRALVI